MDPLSLLTACLVASADPRCTALPIPTTRLHLRPTLDRWQPLIDEAAVRFAIPASWIRAVMRLESGGHETMNGRPTTSPAGAMGLMQLMPATYGELRLRYGFGADPYDPRNNIFAGAAYLHEMYIRYGYPDLFAAYHAGPGRMEAFLLRREPLPNATLDYLDRLAPGTASLVEQPASPAQSTKLRAQNTLFFALHAAEIAGTPSTQNASGASALFVLLTHPSP